MISSRKEQDLRNRMAALGIREEDLLEKFIRASGPGGQKVNKTASGVYLRHLPTGIEVKTARERSQALNRFFARRELCDRIEQIKRDADAAMRDAREKARRQRRQKSKSQKQKMVEAKRHRSRIKSMRRMIPME